MDSSFTWCVTTPVSQRVYPILNPLSFNFYVFITYCICYYIYLPVFLRLFDLLPLYIL